MNERMRADHLWQRKACFFLAMAVCLLTLAADAATPRLRGFTVDQLGTGTLHKAVSVWNANCVRYMMRPSFRFAGGGAGASWKKMLHALPAQLDHAKREHVAVILAMFEFPNEQRKPYPNDGKWQEHFWADDSNSNAFVACWREIAEICKDRDQEIWFDLMNEPLNWSELPRTPQNWPAWAQGAIDAIRSVDQVHPIVVETGPGSLCWGFRDFPGLRGQNLIYSAHMYQPQSYTHQGIEDIRSTDLQKAYLQRQRPWPGEFGDSGGGRWDKARLRRELQPMIEFQQRTGARIYVGEFSVVKWAPNGARYLRDLIETFEELGWDWTYHALDENAVWSPEFTDDFDGTRPSKRASEPTDRGRVLREFMERNGPCESHHHQSRKEPES